MSDQRLTQSPGKTTRPSVCHASRQDFIPPSHRGLPSILRLQRTIGNQAVNQMLQARMLQAKLAVSQPGDVYEQEADRVADQVMRMTDPGIQRTCAPCAAGGSLCPQSTEEKSPKNRRAADSSGIAAEQEVPDDFVRDLGPGQPLDPSTRAFFEPRFGADFSQVRVHTGPQAMASARSVNALAYTVGRDVVFGAGQYLPETSHGKHLLAHELTHVIQQGGGVQRSATHLTIPDPHVSGEAGREEMGRPISHIFVPERYSPDTSQGQRFSITPSSETQVARQGSSDPGMVEPYRADQVECVKRLGGCPNTRPGGIPSPEEIVSYNAECRAETGYTGSGITPTEEECTHEVKLEEASKEASKKVCLTFDDGPQKGTEDCLNALGGTIPATFFLTGKNMASDPATQKTLVERMLKEGHQIGNHTFTHDPMTTENYKKAYGDLSDPAKLKEFQDNYEKNEKHFQSLLGATSPVFTLARLPGNGRFVEVGGKLIYVVATEGLGLSHVTWHFEFGTNGSFGHLKVLDWKGIKGVASEVDRFPGANNTILLHDRHWLGKRALLEDIFKKLSAKSFTFGTLDAAGKCV